MWVTNLLLACSTMSKLETLAPGPTQCVITLIKLETLFCVFRARNLIHCTSLLSISFEAHGYVVLAPGRDLERGQRSLSPREI